MARFGMENGAAAVATGTIFSIYGAALLTGLEVLRRAAVHAEICMYRVLRSAKGALHRLTAILKISDFQYGRGEGKNKWRASKNQHFVAIWNCSQKILLIMLHRFFCLHCLISNPL